jgi:hypothetical protein
MNIYLGYNHITVVCTNAGRILLPPLYYEHLSLMKNDLPRPYI